MATLKPSPVKNPKKISLILILFSLPFAAVGVWSGVSLSSNLVTYWKVQSWVQPPPKIAPTQLKTHDDSESTTYEVAAQYTYQYQGRQYTDSRVDIFGGSDNVGSFHQDAHQKLSEHKRSGRPLPCFVNPSNPSEAILFRTLRWEMVVFHLPFALIFGGAGFGMLAFGIYSNRKLKRNQALAALHPNEPWLCKTDWADGKIKNAAKAATMGLLVFAVFWNILSCPIAWLMIQEEVVGKGHHWALLVLIFPAVGLILLLAAAVSVVRCRKYGRSVFEMAAMPGVIGGQLAGVVRVSRKVRPEDGFRLTLNCVRRTTTHSGDSDRTSETILWQDEQILALELMQNDPEQTAIPVLFQIPYECHATDEADANSQTFWRLEIAAKTPGLDYAATFEVPVFKTPASDPKFVVDRSLIAQYAAPENPERDLAEAGLRKDISPSGNFRLIFPMARHPGSATAITLFGLVFCAVPYAIYRFDGSLWATLFFGGISSLGGLLALLIGASLWFYRSMIDVSPRGISVVGGWFGFGSPRWIDAGDITAIVLRSRMSSGQGSKQQVYYDIDLVRTGGKNITLGKNVVGRRLAESVIRQIKEPLGDRTW